MFIAIGNRLSDLASSDDAQDGDDKEDAEHDTELVMLSDNDESGWVMGRISKTVQHRMQRFRQEQKRLHELTQPRLGHAATYFRERDMKYGTAELKVPAVVKPQRDMIAGAPSQTTF